MATKEAQIQTGSSQASLNAVWFRIRDLAKFASAAVFEVHKVAERQPISCKTTNYVLFVPLFAGL